MPGGLRWRSFILEIDPYTKCVRLQKLAIITYLDKSRSSEVVEERSGGRKKIRLIYADMQRGRAFSDILWRLKVIVSIGEEPLKDFICWQQMKLRNSVSGKQI